MPTYEEAVDAPGTATAEAAEEWYRAIADALSIGASVSTEPGIAVAAGARATLQVQAAGLLFAAVQSNAALEAAVHVAWDMAASDAVQATDSAEGLRTLLAIAAARLRITGAASTQLEAAAAVIAAFTAEGLANPAFDAQAADLVELAATATAIGTLLASAEATLAASADAAGAVAMTAVIDDTLLADAAALSQLTAFQAVTAGLAIGLTLQIGDEVFFAYVLHPQPIDRAGTRPITEYRSFPFNSFSDEEAGRWYAAGAGGVYLLEGEDDAGAPIEAWVRSGLLAFGSASNKRMQQVFLVTTAETTAETGLFLKIVSQNAAGAVVEEWYAWEEAPASPVTTTRARIAAGLKSVHWQYELRNIGGAPFGVKELRFHPLLLEGKVL